MGSNVKEKNTALTFGVSVVLLFVVMMVLGEEKNWYQILHKIILLPDQQPLSVGLIPYLSGLDLQCNYALYMHRVNALALSDTERIIHHMDWSQSNPKIILHQLGNSGSNNGDFLSHYWITKPPNKKNNWRDQITFGVVWGTIQFTWSFVGALHCSIHLHEHPQKKRKKEKWEKSPCSFRLQSRCHFVLIPLFSTNHYKWIIANTKLEYDKRCNILTTMRRRIIIKSNHT